MIAAKPQWFCAVTDSRVLSDRAIMAFPKSVSRACCLSFPRRLRSLVLAGGVLLIAACSPSSSTSDAAVTEAAVEALTPEYAQKDGDAYMYVSVRSEEDIKQGVGAKVVTFRYLGMDGDMHKLEVLDGNGARDSVMECSSPCRVAKQSPVYGPVTRVAVEPQSILAAAFRDAFNGLLVPAALPESAKHDAGFVVDPAPAGKVAANLPDTAVSADFRGKKGRCRLTVNGSSYINGTCWVRLESDGSFQVMSLNGAYFAQLSRSPEGASGFWNETSGSTHAQSELGLMTRNGACWVNDTAEICAWGAV